MPGFIRIALLIQVGVLVACLRDDSKLTKPTENVCEGDRWLSNVANTAELSVCDAITGNLTITGNTLLEVELGRLARVEGSLSVWGNPALARVSLGELREVGRWVDVSENAALTTLELPVLERINESHSERDADLTIQNNALPTCEAEALVDRLREAGFDGTAKVEGNAKPCPR